MRSLITFLLVLFCFNGLTQAQTTKWTGNIDDHWEKPGNWSNGVPDINKTAKIAWFPVGNPNPVIYQSTDFKGLEMGNFGRPYSVALQAGVELVMNNISTPSGGIPSNYLLDIGDANVTVNNLFQNNGKFLIGTGSLIAAGGLTSNGMVEVNGGSVEVGTPTSFANLNTTSESNISLNQGSFTVYGETELAGSSSFEAGSGTIDFHDKVTFEGASVFTPGTSTVILDGSFDLIAENAGIKMDFNQLEIASGSQITSKTELIVDKDLKCEGNLTTTKYTTSNKHGALDVIGNVTGAENITSLYPYIVKLEVTGTNTMKAYFDQDLDQGNAENAGYYEIRHSTDNNSSIFSSVTNAQLIGGHIVELTTANPISESQDFVLFVQGGNQYNSGSWIDGVTNTAYYPVNHPHKKRFTKDFVVWIGDSNTNWDENSNWITSDGFAPGTTADIDLRMSSETVSDLVLQQDVQVANITNESSKNLNLNGHQMAINGSITMDNTGRIMADGVGSTIKMNGTTNQTLHQTHFKNNGIDKLVIANEKGVKLDETLSDSLKLKGILSLEKGIFETKGKLIFKSTASRNAVLAPVQNGSGIVGDVQVERYIPAGDQYEDNANSEGRAFRFLAPPVTSTGSINDNWQEGVHNTQTTGDNFNKNPRPGFGTHITGSTTGENGLDATPSGNPSAFIFHNDTQSWEAITNTEDATLETGRAYRVMIRGDRSINVTSNSAVPSNTVLRTDGEFATGDFAFQNLSGSSNAYNFIANPYQAVVDLGQVLQNAQGLKSNFYVWDPNQGYRGAYVVVDSHDGLSTGNSEANNFLQPGMAFFVQTQSDPSTPAMTFKENYKTLDTVALAVFSNENTARIKVDLYTAEDPAGNDSNSLDGFLVKFSDDYTNDLSDNDAPKFGNLDENMAIVSEGEFLSIEKRNFPTVEDTVQFFNNQYRVEDYRYKIEVDNLQGMTAYLEDAYLETSTALTNNDVTQVSFSVDPDIAESIASDRFRIVYEENALNTDIPVEERVALYPNPTKNGKVSINLPASYAHEMDIEVYSLLGQQVYQRHFKNTGSSAVTLQLPNLEAGVYMVKGKLKTGESFNKKLIVE